MQASCNTRRHWEMPSAHLPSYRARTEDPNCAQSRVLQRPAYPAFALQILYEHTAASQEAVLQTLTEEVGQ